jgi:hypothetical protein
MVKLGSLPRIGTPGQAMLQLADPPGRRYQRDPVLWTKERANLFLWSKQRETIQSVRDHRKTAVHSCHETGKSFVAGTTVCWWLDCHLPGEAFVVTTAPTAPQVEAILWREINRLHRDAGLPGRTNLTEWYIGRELVAFGRKPSDYNTHAFQGLHARKLLVVIDEACGVVKSMWDAASTLAANEHSRILVIGNPDDVQTEFGKVCAKDSDWNVIKIGYADTPNFTGEDVPRYVNDVLIHPVWVEDRAKHWGRESAIFQSKCEGVFPTVGDPYATIPYAWAIACKNTELPLNTATPKEAGIDVGGGGDRTILRVRQGRVALEEYIFIDSDPMRTVGKLATILREQDVQRVKVDSTGIGWGICGRLKELSSRSNPAGSERDWAHDAEVVAVNFAESPPAGYDTKVLNMRAFMHWIIGRENCRLRTWDLTRVDDDTIAELTASRYEIMDSAGKVKIERKDEIIKRMGMSPDKSDALLLAFLEVHHEAILPNIDLITTDVLAGSGPQDVWDRYHDDIFGGNERDGRSF